MAVEEVALAGIATVESRTTSTDDTGELWVTYHVSTETGSRSLIVRDLQGGKPRQFAEFLPEKGEPSDVGGFDLS